MLCVYIVILLIDLMILDRFDDNNMILGYHKIIKIFNFQNQKIIQPIFNDKEYTCLFNLKNEGLFFTGGGKDIKVYRNDNFKCILKIYNAHFDDILGFTMIKKNVIASYSKSGGIHFWKKWNLYLGFYSF